MDIKKLGESLHPLERKVLPNLKNIKEFLELTKASNLSEVETMRALQWLENRDALKIKKEVQEVIELDKNGTTYLKEGLPEKRLLKSLTKKPLSLQDAQKLLDKNELNISIGLLKRKSAITFDKGIITITDQGKKLLTKDSLEEIFLKKLPTTTDKLEDQDKFALNELKSRKEIIKLDTKKIVTIELTDLGKKLTSMKLDPNLVDSLTPAIIRSGKPVKFRRYDVKINVPAISGGKRHYVRQAIDYARSIWTDLGFKEMEGPLLNTSFWNFDALFTAQDHPVRDLQDTFYIKNPKAGSLPNPKLVQQVKKAHEGGIANSKGWQYSWNPEEAMKNVLRTHTSVLSARTLAQIKKDQIPAKYFAVGRCFRNETVDWSHLFEFNQTEGIVVDKDANFRNLLGYLKEFFNKMGYDKVRFRPAHFPYTEPSCEMDIFHPIHKKWVELGGAGVFRPELVIPLLGEDIPVLAWGPGFDRIIMEYYKITDLRDLYSSDLKKLRDMKCWIK